MMILVFIPFLLAASALFFKGTKARFNLFIMGSILVLLFLAKGLHPPFGDLLLYQNISIMSMFREPVSKFTLLVVPFLALLIGYAVANLANLRFRRLNSSFYKVLVISLVFAVFIASVYPFFIYSGGQNSNGITDTKGAIENGFSGTQQFNSTFSPYTQIPSYWYQATNWINSQPGDWKVLMTPLDDYYQMPYSWGVNGSWYYGTDQLVDGLIDKPLISSDCLNGYKINPDTATNFQQLYYSMKYGWDDQFRALLDLMNIRYIFQRNDVVTDINRTTLTSPKTLMSQSEVTSFFAKQPYMKLSRTVRQDRYL